MREMDRKCKGLIHTDPSQFSDETTPDDTTPSFIKVSGRTKKWVFNTNTFFLTISTINKQTLCMWKNKQFWLIFILVSMKMIIT